MAVDRASSEFSISSLSALAGLWIIYQKMKCGAEVNCLLCVCVCDLALCCGMARVESDCLSVGSRFLPLLPQSC